MKEVYELTTYKIISDNKIPIYKKIINKLGPNLTHL